MELHIQSFGARLRTRGEIFVLTTPDLSGAGDDKVQEIAPHQINLILLYEKGGSASSDAIALAIRNDIDVLLCDVFGMPTGRFLRNEPSNVMGIQAMQFRLIGTPEGLEYVKVWLSRKIRRKLAFLEQRERYRDGEKEALLQTTRRKLAEYHTSIGKMPTKNILQAVESIRGYEGTASKLYFATLSNLLQPEYQFDGRSRRPAQDIFNCFLNYGYGILYRQVEKALMEAGIHPYAGFLHGLEKRQKAMVFDFMESYRPWVDGIVFQLCSRKHATLRHIIEKPGGYWLSGEGKTLMLGAYREWFNERQLEYEGDLISPALLINKEVMQFSKDLYQEWRKRNNVLHVMQ